MLMKTALLVVAMAAAAAHAWPQSPALAQAQSQSQAQAQYRLAQAQTQALPEVPAQLQYAQSPYAQAPALPQQYVDPRQLAKLRAAAGAAVRTAAPAGAAPPRGLQQEPEDYDPNPQYQFSFDVKDDEFTNYQNRKEQRDGGKISGSYSVVDSDGFIRTVKYTADPLEGFKAEVTREPTNIVVKLPTPPQPQPQPQLQQQPQPQPQPQAQPQSLSSPQRQLQTHQYLQGTLGVQPPQSQVYASLSHLPRRLPHVAQAAPQPAAAPAPAPQPQFASAPPQYSLAPQQFAPAPAPQHYSAAPQQYSAAPQQYQLAAAPAAPSATAAPAPRPIKAGAIGFATQEPGGGSVIYQAYQQ